MGSADFCLHASLMRRACARVGAIAGAALLGWLLLAAPANAQTGAPGAPATGAPIYSPAQLDQLLAPVALYPDDLLGQILMAATYPLEVVQADRWLQNPSNASLRGSPLADALQQLPWDTSVKSLVAYPQILSWLDSALDWTEAAGDAFLAQQADVMDSVQRLRSRAQAAGSLSSTPQETVTGSDQAIQIASPDPSVEYVPVYSPDTAYGPWPNPDYPPYDFSPGYAVGTYIAFPVLVPYWGWDRWDWRHHRIDVDGDGGRRRDPDRPDRGPGHRVPWRHDPVHRGGVPYRDPVTRARYEGHADIHAAGSGYRGFPAGSQPAQSNRPPARSGSPAPIARAPIAERPAPVPQVQRIAPEMPRAEVRRPEPAMPRPEAPRPAPAMPRPEAPRPAPAMPRYEAPRPAPAMPRPEAPRPAMIERPMPPAMESFGRGAEVHVQEQRGVASRAAPAGGGGHR
jgi:hypothetical protein